MKPEIIIELEKMSATLSELADAIKSTQEQTEKVAYLMLKFGAKWAAVAEALAAYDKLIDEQKETENDN